MAAGLGFIEFTTGDVLTAAAANGYLASQVVMVFADSAARTTAITSPQEGMISFLKDTNAVEAYDGAAWVGVGGASLNADRTYVATQEGTTANDTYVDLTTVQSVTLTTGTKALVAFTVKTMNNATTDLRLRTSFAISGATTLAASDDRAAEQYIGTSANIQLPMSGIFVMTGLTAGSNTFTLKFKGSTGSSKFWESRHISVVDLGN